MTNSDKHERILIIESDLNVARTIASLCFALGHEPLVAQDGFTGMLLARRIRPRVIFADLTLPGLDGFEIVRRIRRLPELAHTAVVALTENTPRRPAANQLGFDDFVMKPLNPMRLEHIIARFCVCIAQHAHA
ncbi:MAG TPA: response regulator [Planctomycetota bacterium]|nr:response regulator [Planctomycetota bacterium]